LTVLADVCDCGAQLINVEYKAEKTKLPNSSSEMKGCVFCTSEFGRLVDKPKTAVNTRPRPFRGGKAPNRGRGRARGKPKDKMAQLAAYFV
jgi:DNA topoisomerase-3